MPKLNQEGEYDVTIVDAKWTKMEGKNGQQDYLAAHLKFETENGDTAEKLVTLMNSLIQNGKNAGRSWKQVNFELLQSLGMPNDYMQIGVLIGKLCRIVIEEDDYNGKTTYNVAWVNPPRREYKAADDATIHTMLAEFNSAPVQQQQAAQSVQQAPAQQAQQTQVSQPSFQQPAHNTPPVQKQPVQQFQPQDPTEQVPF